MNTNVLHQVETDDVIFFTENQYNRTEKSKYLAVFNEMVADGTLEGRYSDMKWMGFSGVKRFGIDFSMDKNAYA